MKNEMKVYSFRIKADLYKTVRMIALKQDKSTIKWFTEAIKEKLEKEK